MPFFSNFFSFPFCFFLSIFCSDTGLAALNANILANMKQEELNNGAQLSPSSLIAASLQPDATNVYAGLFSAATGSPLNMLTPQMFAANQSPQMAALLAARLNSASNFYPHTFFPWQLPPMSNASPPISPISPGLSVNSLKQKINNDMVSTTTNDSKNDLKSSPISNNSKKGNKRKTNNYKKQRNQSLYQPYSSNLDTPTSNVRQSVSPGPISPPRSGSSPQSIGSIEHQSPSSSTVHATPNKETTVRDKSFTCKTCNRSFGYKHVLQNHERTHTGEKPFVCKECDKRFTRDHHLKTHIRLHTGEKPYSCQYCDRLFTQVANLRRHLRVHTGEKPFTCTKCSSKFSDSNQLKAHAVLHQEQKTFRCTTCDASFLRNHQLINHKCTNGLLTPATSPVDTKSVASRSDTSDIDMSTQSATILKKLQSQALQQMYESTLSKAFPAVREMPLDLSVEAGTDSNEKRNRKSNDVRHILRMPKDDNTTDEQCEPTDEQTEPEDLSMHSPRSASPMLDNSSEDDLDDLDDAESLNRKHKANNAKC